MLHTESRALALLLPSLGRAAFAASFGAALLVLGGCATLVAMGPSPAGPTGAAQAAAAQAAVFPPPPLAASSPAGSVAAAPPAALAPGQPPLFATVIKDAKRNDGLIGFWQREEKVWLELSPDDFNRPLFLSPKLARGIGEAGIFGGSMRVPGSRVYERMVEFRRVHNIVQLVELNNDFVARDAKSPQARAVAASFSHSILASVPVASQPHPEHKGVLVDAAGLFLNDMLGLGAALQRAFRQGYALEGRNTHFGLLRATPEMLVLNVNAHFYSANIAAATPGAPPGAPVPITPRSLPDPRSMVLGIHYSISKLPDQPMARRLADARIGHFVTAVDDFSDDIARTPRQRFVNRWRLEKKDPAAALSEPVKPITFWLDNTIPLKYREAITRGVLEWNKAFEKIGFKDAVVAKVQPDDAAFDTLDVNVASIRWLTNASPWYGAIGPSHVDPRSGEILDADIAFESLSSRNIRSARAQVLTGRSPADWLSVLQARDAMVESAGASLASPGRNAHAAHGHGADEVCLQADLAAEQLGYALDVLDARGDLDPDSPQAQEFVQAYLTDTTIHEVGHTLGLRHNFRSSRVYTEKQLSDREFTSANGLAGSVMEYAPINLPRPGEIGGTPFQTTLGPYDYWAIEYAYKPIAAADEVAELRRIAARSADPQLAYGSDEDNSLGIDPESLHMDLGDDPVAFAKKRLEIARDMIRRQETRVLKPEADYAVLRRSVNYAVNDAARAIGILSRQIGGVRTLRDHPGSGRDPLVPVSAAVQREALEVLATQVLASDGLRISAALQRKLAPDFNERGDAIGAGDSGVATDYSPVTVMVNLQRALLAQLMSDGLASRLLDSEGKVEASMVTGKSADRFRLSELYGRITREIWSDLGAGGDVPVLRRELQRDHASRLATTLLRPSGMGRADAKSLIRADAMALLVRLNAAVKRPGGTAETRAHLADTAETLAQALAARLQRAGA
ncbi:MAG: zinc-dependent metalloprotease [Burkholderiaceae bacterium]